jgi:hypothetical protein
MRFLAQLKEKAKGLIGRGRKAGEAGQAAKAPEKKSADPKA